MQSGAKESASAPFAGQSTRPTGKTVIALRRVDARGGACLLSNLRPRGRSGECRIRLKKIPGAGRAPELDEKKVERIAPERTPSTVASLWPQPNGRSLEKKPKVMGSVRTNLRPALSGHTLPLNLLPTPSEQPGRVGVQFFRDSPHQPGFRHMVDRIALAPDTIRGLAQISAKGLPALDTIFRHNFPFYFTHRMRCGALAASTVSPPSGMT